MPSHPDSICSGVNAPEEFQDLLHHWIGALAKYQREMTVASGGKGTDHGWYYNERANIGFLAAAAWLAGGVALEEYRWDKTCAGKSRHGRSDLYIYLNRREYHFEAKIAHALSRKDCFGTVKKKLGEAVKDAGKIKCKNKKTRYGLLFFLPCKKGKKAFSKEDVFHSISEIKTECDSMAWYFPKDDTKVLYAPNRDKTFGGVILLIQKFE